MIRGRQIAECDAARRLAVETLWAERAAIDAALLGIEARGRETP